MDPGTIVIAVGERVFRSTKQTLQHSGYFRGLLEACTLDRPIIIDRDGELFKEVLLFLRCPYVKFPSKYKEELDFYDIPYNHRDLEYIGDDLVTQLPSEISFTRAQRYYLWDLPDKTFTCSDGLKLKIYYPDPDPKIDSRFIYRTPNLLEFRPSQFEYESNTTEICFDSDSAFLEDQTWAAVIDFYEDFINAFAKLDAKKLKKLNQLRTKE